MLSLLNGQQIQKAIINRKNTKCSACFAYSITAALNHQNIQNHPEKIKNIAPFIDQYNFEDIDFPAGIKDWKKLEQNNKTIAYNILQVPHNEKNIIHVYKSKHDHTRKNQGVLLMITDGEKWHYTALKSRETEDSFNRPIKSVSRLFSGIKSNNNGDFYCLNCLHSFRTYNILKKHEKLCENNDFCKVDMPSKKNNILKYSDGLKSLKIPFVIYADFECLLLKQQSCQNNPDKSYTERKAIQEPFGYSLDLVCSFDLKENKNSFYRGEDCIKKFCKELQELETKIINYDQKEMIPLTDKENKYYENQKKMLHMPKKVLL